MPSVLLTNANRLLNKLDELSILCSSVQPVVISITETWLTDEITNECMALSVNNYNYAIYRRDRNERQGGGVAIYVRADIQSHSLSYIDMGSHEVLWVALRPRVLPRPISIIICGTVYCPPWYSADLKNSLINYIVNAVDSLRRKYSNAAFIINGDFNSLDTAFVTRYTNSVQIQSSDRVLDRIFVSANCAKFYYPISDILPPLGKSDHCCVLLQPLSRNLLPPVGYSTVFKRNFNDFNLYSIAFQCFLPIGVLCIIAMMCNFNVIIFIMSLTVF